MTKTSQPHGPQTTSTPPDPGLARPAPLSLLLHRPPSNSFCHGEPQQRHAGERPLVSRFVGACQIRAQRSLIAETQACTPAQHHRPQLLCSVQTHAPLHAWCCTYPTAAPSLLSTLACLSPRTCIAIPVRSCPLQRDINRSRRAFRDS